MRSASQGVQFPNPENVMVGWRIEPWRGHKFMNNEEHEDHVLH